MRLTLPCGHDAGGAKDWICQLCGRCIECCQCEIRGTLVHIATQAGAQALQQGYRELMARQKV